MKRVTIGGHAYRAYEPNEIGNPPDAPTTPRKRTELDFAIRLLGTGAKPGPLMQACQRAAERRER